MRSKLLFALLAVLISAQLHAQRKIRQMDSEKQEQDDAAKASDRKPWRDKVSFGGNLWAQFGSSGRQTATVLVLQPMVFYKITEKTFAGAGVTYMYIAQTLDFGGRTYSSTNNIYGINLLARQLLFGPVFAQVEYCPLNFQAMNGYGDTKRVWGQSLLLGGGLSQQAGSGSVYFSVLYDVLWREFTYVSPDQYNTTFYTSPLRFNFGFMF